MGMVSASVKGFLPWCWRVMAARLDVFNAVRHIVGMNRKGGNTCA
jgi:hypothetical protein